MGFFTTVIIQTHGIKSMPWLQFVPDSIRKTADLNRRSALLTVVGFLAARFAPGGDDMKRGLLQHAGVFL